ncbi:MAG TPA: autoinducer binding domain-containing protein [Casimicrobiaceae bacterium]|nr:autoinducer binding domain-containing protein [Casimicrobiaceae bacterium]
MDDLLIVLGASCSTYAADALTHAVQSLGYDNAIYTSLVNDIDGQRVHITHAGSIDPGWLEEYRANRYFMADPVLLHGVNRWPAPLAWDCALADGDRQRAVLDRAAHYGAGSGLAIYLRDAVRSVVVSLNWSSRRLCPERQAISEALLGISVDLAFCLHWLIVKRWPRDLAMSYTAASPGSLSLLSEREIECLALASRGLTSADIALKTGITARTVDYHFHRIVGKLGVLNRKEAIAFAIAHGIVSRESLPVPYRAVALSSRVLGARRRWETRRARDPETAHQQVGAKNAG